MRGSCFLSIILLMFLASCNKKRVQYSVSPANNFVISVIDSVDSAYNYKVNDVLTNGQTTLMYVCSNECSECISRFVDFHEKVVSNTIDSINIVYWIYGYDPTLFKYYMKQHDIEIGENKLLVMDTLDIFHNIIHDFYSNNLFLVKSNKTISRLICDKPEYYWELKDIEKCFAKPY